MAEMEPTTSPLLKQTMRRKQTDRTQMKLLQKGRGKNNLSAPDKWEGTCDFLDSARVSDASIITEGERNKKEQVGGKKKFLGPLTAFSTHTSFTGQW